MAIGYSMRTMETHFESCREIAAVDNGYGTNNEAQRKPIVLCRYPVSSWDEIWPQLGHLD